MQTPTLISRGPLAAALLSLGIALLAAMCFAPASSADVTIGANVNINPTTSGTCGFRSASERPCVFVDTIVPGLATTSPCDGTVTRFRLNGLPKPNDLYSLRVIRKNADQTFTGTATSAPVSIASDGVNEYATSLPISAGEYVGVDFQGSTEDFGLRWVEQPGSGANYLNAFPADGGSSLGTGASVISYLYNADVACTPSNEFHVGRLKGTSLSVELASAGVVTVTGAAKAKASAASTSQAKPKLLKPSTASGGPGSVKVKLRLTAAAKKLLREKGKVRIHATIAFTPTGGTAATQTRSLTVREHKTAK